VDWRQAGEQTVADLKLYINGETHTLQGTGNGSLDAVSSALRKAKLQPAFRFDDYAQHALGGESDARAAAYVKLSDGEGKSFWGVGLHNDITRASVLALISAVNRKLETI